MALVFPSSPTPGQTYVGPNNITYTWDNALGVWTGSSPGAGGLTAASPAQAAAGTLNTVASTPQTAVPKDASGMTGAALIPAGTDAQRAAIATPVAGMQRFNTTQSSMEYYDGTNWRGPYEYIASSGWVGGSPGAIAQQFVTSSTLATFTVNPITLTPGTWLLALNFWASCTPNNPAGVFGMSVIFPYGSTGTFANPNIVWISKPDGPTFRGVLTSSAAAMELDTLIAMKVGPGNLTINQIIGNWADLGTSGAGPHDLKVNAWLTAMRID